MLGGIIAADALVLKHQDINICNTAWMAIAQPKIDKKKEYVTCDLKIYRF